MYLLFILDNEHKTDAFLHKISLKKAIGMNNTRGVFPKNNY